MRKKIPLVLSEKGVDLALKQVRDYRKWLKDKTEELVRIMCEAGKGHAIIAVTHIDTGATMNSIQGYATGNKGVIVAGGNAIWIEFGTGITKNGPAGGSPHPEGDNLGMLIGEYGDGHGADEDGWWYWNEDRGRFEHTYGIQANAFLYNTAQILKQQAPEYAKGVFKFD